MRQTHRFFTYQPIGEQPQPDVRIILNEPFTLEHDEHIDSLDVVGRQKQLMDEEADALAEILHNTLPQGVFDRLVAELLKRHASALVVNKRA